VPLAGPPVGCLIRPEIGLDNHRSFFKLDRALRTQSVIGVTRDFGIGRCVCALNWNALRAVGDSANRRLCDVEAQTAQPAPDVVTLTHVTPAVDY
jgi:hypothetical protein